MAKLNDVFSSSSEKRKGEHPKRITKWLHYTKLKDNAYQYCDAKSIEEIEALADLIEADGEVLQDLIVRKTDTDEYEIIAGHKRRAACRLLVETREKTEYAFLPCLVSDMSDVHAQFAVYSSNGHHEETPYETMHKLEKMAYLLDHYPEEFPDMQTGRMVERLAKLYNMKKTTVGEYQQISKNLGDQAMEAFKEGKVDKSAAKTLSTMPVPAQERCLDEGHHRDTDIRKFREEQLVPDAGEISRAYELLDIREIDQIDRAKVETALIKRYGRHCYYKSESDIEIDCSPRYITVNKKQITWRKFIHLLDTYCPYVLPSEISLYLTADCVKYKVMRSEDATERYKAHYQIEDSGKWHPSKAMDWRENFWAAQDDLDRCADRQGWRKVEAFPEPEVQTASSGSIPGQMAIHNTNMELVVEDVKTNDSTKAVPNFGTQLAELPADDTGSVPGSVEEAEGKEECTKILLRLSPAHMEKVCAIKAAQGKTGMENDVFLETFLLECLTLFSEP